MDGVIKSYKIVKLKNTGFFIKDNDFFLDELGNFTGSLTKDFQNAKIFNDKEISKHNFTESTDFEIVDVKLVLQ
ncbi:hypothetical protein vBBcePLY3_00007 [Bacillus phage vB_BceP_LY3]|uniref:Uncharacterized protein n=1 Tax=Bacillus phage vB_BceP_LY3 TaxID=2950458 RepID=A0A9Y1CVP3_9CAUD|nr:hypothetical protein vBBcePLY3_00007 [Bacillus phage vB_BceP_LY3]